jgi:hypothetical protein
MVLHRERRSLHPQGLSSASPVDLEFLAFFHGQLAQPGKLFKNTVTG